MSDPIYIVVDGLTGAGKSTLIEEMLVPELRDAGYEVVFVRELAADYGQLLADYYADPARWAFTFQTKVIGDRVENFKRVYVEDVSKNYHKLVFISERDEHADAVFAQVHANIGNMTAIEFECYNDIWQTLVASLPMRADITIYLDVSVEESLRRIANRDRAGEHVNESYQQALAEAARPRLGPNLIITENFDDGDLAQLFGLMNIVYDERTIEYNTTNEQ